MRFLRTLLFYLLFLPFTALVAFMTVVAGKLFPSTGMAAWWSKTWGKGLVALSGLKIDADVPDFGPHDPCVYVSNHQSLLDIPVLMATLPQKKIGFLAKKSLFDIPLFGQAMHAAGHVSIDRENPRAGLKSIDAAAKAASRGDTCPVIFPEGTRNPHPETLSDFKVGVVILAVKSTAPCVPVVIYGTSEALPKGSLLFRPVTIKVKALPMIEPGRYTMKQREEFMHHLRQTMGSTLEELRRG